MVEAGEHGRDIVYSILSLAALADTGWYDVNWSYGHDVTWGYKAGCAFLNDKCIAQDLTATFKEFCVNTDYNSSCSYNRLHKGVCSMTRYTSPIPK